MLKNKRNYFLPSYLEHYLKTIYVYHYENTTEILPGCIFTQEESLLQGCSISHLQQKYGNLVFIIQLLVDSHTLVKYFQVL